MSESAGAALRRRNRGGDQGRSGFVAALNALGGARALIVIVTLLLSIGWLVLAVVFGDIPVRPGLIDRLGGVAGGDFMYFYAVGVLSSTGKAAVAYSTVALTEAGRHAITRHLPDLVWVYPPTMALPLALLGKLSPARGLVAWLAFSAAAMAIEGRLVLGAWRRAPVAILFPGAAFVLFAGHFVPVLGLFLAVSFVYASRWPVVGGSALGFFVLKPQFGVVPGIALLLSRKWRGIAAMTVVGVGLALLSLAFFGKDTWGAFLSHSVPRAGALAAETPIARFVTVFGTAITFGARATVALAIHLAACVAVAVFAWRLWTRTARPSLRALGLTASTVLVSPYAFDYNLVLLLLPWLLLIRECLSEPGDAVELFPAWLSITCLVPVSYFVQLYTGRSVGGVLLLGILSAASWRMTRSADDASAPGHVGSMATVTVER